MGNIQPTEQSCRQPRELLRADNKKRVTARKNMAPQIIVIPQNLLQQKQTQAKSVLRISPQPKQFRVIASNIWTTCSRSWINFSYSHRFYANNYHLYLAK